MHAGQPQYVIQMTCICIPGIGLASRRFFRVSLFNYNVHHLLGCSLMVRRQLKLLFNRVFLSLLASSSRGCKQSFDMVSRGDKENSMQYPMTMSCGIVELVRCADVCWKLWVKDRRKCIAGGMLHQSHGFGDPDNGYDDRHP